MIQDNARKILEGLEEKDNRKAKRKLEKQQRKAEKYAKKQEILKKREENTKTLLANASFSQMSVEQKIWFSIKLFFYAATPFLIYMIMPGIIITLGTVLFDGLKSAPDTSQSDATNFYTFIGIICALIYLFRSAKRRGSTVGQDITISFHGLNYKYIAMMFAFGFCISTCISAILTLLPDAWMAGYDSSTLDLQNGNDLLMALLSVTILDPIAEEIVFRGYMLNRLLPTLKETASVWIVTILFALVHISPIWILYVIGLGWILAKVSIRHDNIMYSIAIHIGFNFTTLVSFILLQYPNVNDALFSNKIVVAVYAILFGALTFLLVRYYDSCENIGIFSRKSRSLK